MAREGRRGDPAGTGRAMEDRSDPRAGAQQRRRRERRATGPRAHRPRRVRDPSPRTAPDGRRGPSRPPAGGARRASTTGWPRSACSSLPEPVRARPRRPRPAPPGLDRGDQPDRDPRARRGGPRARPRQPGRAAAPARRGASTTCSTSGSGGGFPGLPLALALPGPPRAARRVRRQEGDVPGDRRRGRSGSTASRRGRRRAGRGRWPPIRAIASAGRPSSSGPSAARRARRAGAAAPRARRAARRVEARRRRRRAGRRGRPGPPARRREPGRRADRSAPRPGRSRPRRDRQGRGRRRPAIRAIPPSDAGRLSLGARPARRNGAPSGRHWLTLMRCGSPSCRTSTPTSSPSTRCSRRSARSTPSGSLGDVVGYGPEPDAVVERLRERRRDRGPRQPRRGRARRRRDRAASTTTPARAIEWTRGRSVRRPATGSAALPERSSRATSRSSTAARATRPGSTSTTSPSRGQPRGVRRPRSACSATPTCRRVFRDEDGSSRSLSPSDGSTLDLDDRRACWQPGQRRPAARRRPAGERPRARSRTAHADLAPGRLRHRGDPAGDAPAAARPRSSSGSIMASESEW